MKTYWSEKFNNLSYDTRKIGAAMELQLRIQHLEGEKERLQTRHRQSIKEINEYILNCRDSLDKLELENQGLQVDKSPC